MNYRELEDQYSTGVYFKRDAVIVRGEGAKLWDEAGREYVDCIGGHGSVNTGHCNPAVVKAIEAQANKLISCTEVFYNDVRAEFLAKLATITPPGLDRFFLCNSGAEAVEEALKFARMATGRTEIIACNRAFHGRTMGALSATWDPKYREPF
ncbi:MAG: aminotransferase class III-fold pyridoxal phosphate-dependent enzyme, partial [Chloroflexota bacterium]